MRGLSTALSAAILRGHAVAADAVRLRSATISAKATGKTTTAKPV
jgi:hypothetical protein